MILISFHFSFEQTGKSKHFGFIEFMSPEVVQFYLRKYILLHGMLSTISIFLTNEFSCLIQVAKIVEECMHNYLMYEHMLQVSIVPPEKVHPKL